jgi:hypothetical protein
MGILISLPFSAAAGRAASTRDIWAALEAQRTGRNAEGRRVKEKTEFRNSEGGTRQL